ncbi:MAG TPA: hypothetical protein VGO26_03880 [Amnibacterium sp.]|jgi:hypothetical protein|nr:hypothetical protein [Amnibacterium sp.]
MLLLWIVLAVLAVVGIAATVRAVRSDGYGPRPTRGDRFTDPRRFL